MSQIATTLTTAIDTVNEVLEEVPDNAWHRPTPCTDWDVHGVVGHITGTMLNAGSLLSGADAYDGTPSGTTAEMTPDAVLSAWSKASGTVADLLVTADLERQVDSPRGPMSLAEALALPAADLSVHAWDIGASIGIDVELPEELLANVRRVGASLPPDQLRSPGLFGPEVPAPEGATETERLMAWLGRSRPAAVT